MGRATRINDIDNERFHRNPSMTLSMKRVQGVREDRLPESEVDALADCLVETLGAPGSKPLYCDAVRYLSRGFLEEKLAYAQKRAKTTPAKLFGAIIFNKLLEAGIYPKH